MWHLKRSDTNELTKQKETDLENKLMVAGGKDKGKGWLGSLGWTCTNYYVSNE